MQPPAPDADPHGLLRKPFDHYGRYRLAAEFVEQVRPSGRASVLDVGGGPGSLAAFLPDDFVVATDLHRPSDWYDAAPSLVVADGSRLPFADASFDVVVSLDTLEHVLPEAREPFLAELARVAASWLLVVCPCATPGVAEADELVLAFVRRYFGDAFPTVEVLEEHLRYGHPEPTFVIEQLGLHTAEVAVLPSGHLGQWLPMMLLFYHLLSLRNDALVETLQAWYNARFWRDDLRAPSYRQAFVAKADPAAAGSAAAMVAALTATRPAEHRADSAFAALRVSLESAAVAGLTDAVRLSDELRAELDEAAAELDKLRQERDGAEASAREHAGLVTDLRRQVAGLEEFRARVLAHPALRARRWLRRALRRP